MSQLDKRLKIRNPRPRVHVIDFYANDTIEGRVNGKKNVLTRGFWALLVGLLADINISMRNTSGTEVTIRTSHEVNQAPAYLVVGTGTASESFSIFNVSGIVGNVSTAISLGIMGDRNRISLTGSAPSSPTSFSEVGIIQLLYDTGNIAQYILLARKLISGSAGQTINYSIDFFEPWSYNMANFIHGIFRNADVPGEVDVGGNVYTVRTSYEVNAGPVRLAVSESAETWTPNKATVTQPIEMTTYLTTLSTDQIVYLIATGLLVPPTQMSVKTIVFVQKLYDTTPTARDTIMLILSLPSPITFEANRTNMIQLRVIAL